MPAWIEKDLTTLAFLWRLERRDGVTLGFTTHDRDLVVNGLTYRAAPGMLPSAIERSNGFDPDNVELSGALTSGAIRDDDLRAGRWDGASLRLDAVSWEAPDSDPVFFARGEFGSVETSGNKFSVELRGPTSALEGPVTIETSPDCRARLGDALCRVNMADRRRFARIVSTSGSAVTLDQAAADGLYAFGTLRWIDGDNSGLESRIIQSTGATLMLVEAPSFAVTAGTLVEIVEGCDKQFSTCVNRFANAINFRGEPHLPGNDLLTRYAS